MNAEWLTEAIRRGVCPANEWWISHAISGTQSFKGRTVGSLDRPAIEIFTEERVGQYRDAVGQDETMTEETQTERYRDLNALGQAWTVLQRFKQAVKQEHSQLEFHQGTIPFPAAPIMGPEAELDLSPKQEAGDHSITGQTETATEVPATESSETTEASAELHEWEAGIVQINSDLLSLVEHRENFIVALDRARRMLDEVRDPWVVKNIVDTADKLRAIADLLELGHDLEMRGKALRFDGFYKAGQLFDAPKGRQKNGQLDPLGCFNNTEKKIIGLLRPFEPEDYRRLRDDGIKNGTLSENTFKTPAAPKAPKPQDTSHLDPTRFLIDYVVDMRQNLTWYTTLSRVEEFANDRRVLENLGPIVDQFLEFSIALSSLVRSKYNEQREAASSEN